MCCGSDRREKLLSRDTTGPYRRKAIKTYQVRWDIRLSNPRRSGQTRVDGCDLSAVSTDRYASNLYSVCGAVTRLFSDGIP
ncbi:hypothetical protein AArcS_2852 [Natranaeroarchaeum sulfidigenes]|uniref:Uncharacterized protein n=1 Tax=Natranaeroarchaeum sulfidigenes TaxID=2784880 RepID=A0A897MU51_9EURY|nr:hypothetical protein AArcS_2852 [Natranaeroarchaeum sulfidigenes]